MKVIGVECSGNELIFVVSTGTQQNPILIDSGRRPAPTGCSRPDELKWLRKEITAILNSHKPDLVVLRGTLSAPKYPVSQERAQFEGVVMEAVSSFLPTTNIERRVTNEIKKSLDLSKAKGKEILVTVVTDSFPTIYKYLHDAALASLSGLPRNDA